MPRKHWQNGRAKRLPRLERTNAEMEALAEKEGWVWNESAKRWNDRYGQPICVMCHMSINRTNTSTGRSEKGSQMLTCGTCYLKRQAERRKAEGRK